MKSSLMQSLFSDNRKSAPLIAVPHHVEDCTDAGIVHSAFQNYSYMLNGTAVMPLEFLIDLTQASGLLFDGRITTVIYLVGSLRQPVLKIRADS